MATQKRQRRIKPISNLQIKKKKKQKIKNNKIQHAPSLFHSVIACASIFVVVIVVDQCIKKNKGLEKNSFDDNYVFV